MTHETLYDNLMTAWDYFRRRQGPRARKILQRVKQQSRSPELRDFKNAVDDALLADDHKFNDAMSEAVDILDGFRTTAGGWPKAAEGVARSGTMRKIATPQDLQAALRHILASTEGPERPSRVKLAAELRELADRVAKDKGKDSKDDEDKDAKDDDAKKPFPGAAAPFKKKTARVGPLLDRVYSVSDELMNIQRGLDLDRNGVHAFRDAGKAVRALEPIVEKAEGR